MATKIIKMATFVDVLSLCSLYVIFLSFPVTKQEGNSTGYDSIANFYDQNVTDIENSSATAQPEFPTTTPSFSDATTEDPVSVTSPLPTPFLSPEPLPLSGLPSPLTNVARLCPCDEQRDLCDINCCCDSDCSEELSLFTDCSIDKVSGNNKMCSQDVAYYSLGSTMDGLSELHTTVQKELNYDVFCIQSQNRVEGLSHPSPVVPSARNFDSLIRKFADYIFGSERDGSASSTKERQTLSGYLYGDIMAAVGENGERGILHLPAPGISTDCVDMNPAAFLKEQSSRCSRSLVLDRDCTSLPALNMNTYIGIQLLSGKKTNAVVVAVEMTSVVQQSLEGAQTQVNLSVGENLDPVLLSPAVCANVVLQVDYVVRYNQAGEIVNVTASLVLGAVRGDILSVEQEFTIQFVQENAEEVVVHYSGNPGYVVGLPLVTGSRTADGIIQSADPKGTLTVLQGAMQQDCLRGPHQRTPVLFGLDMAAGCTLRLEDAANCSLVSQVLLGVLRGQNYPQYVASFGTSQPQNPMDWVPIRNNSKPGEAQSCSIPLSFHLEIQWTKYGSFVNPQAQIVSIKEVINSNTSNLDSLSGGSSVISVTSSVAFVPVSAAAQPGFRASPTIDAKLPFDFLFPFV